MSIQHSQRVFFRFKYIFIRRIYISIILNPKVLNIDTDFIMEKFHQARKEEYITASWFISQWHLHISLRRFQYEYDLWRRKNGIEKLVVTPEKYLKFLSEKFNVPYEPLIEFWYRKKHSYNGLSPDPKRQAFAIMAIVHPEIPRKQLLLLSSGMTLEVLEKYIGIITNNSSIRANNARGERVV